MGLFHEAIEEHLPEDWPIMIGLDGECGVCAAIMKRPDEDFHQDVINGKVFDSGYRRWGICYTCGTKKHIIKHAAHTIDPSEKFIHLDICGDCLNYFVNNEDPEDWSE